jgi:hypothetical protein
MEAVSRLFSNDLISGVGHLIEPAKVVEERSDEIASE